MTAASRLQSLSNYGVLEAQWSALPRNELGAYSVVNDRCRSQ